MDNRIRIAVVEDDADWCKMMVNFLNKEPDFFVAGTAAGKDEAIRLAQNLDLDFIIMDINLSGNNTDGVEAAATIHGFSPVKIIMLSVLEESEVILDSFGSGALYYLRKEKFRNVPEVIRSLHSEKAPIEVLLEDYHRLKRKEYLSPLSPAEAEIFSLLEEGLSQKEIAAQLVKSADTIKVQISSILRKLNVHSVKEAVKRSRF